MRILLFLLVGCGSPSAGPEVQMSGEMEAASQPSPRRSVALPAETNPERDTPDQRTRSFDREIMAIANDFRTWGRVDDQSRWAPGLCAMPYPGNAQFTASTHTDSHGGNKLYTISALVPEDYGFFPTQLADPVPDALAGVEQAIVKDSYHPREVGPANRNEVIRRGAGTVPAERDGHLYALGEPIGLYIMLRLREPTVETDEGWVYATVLPDGRISAAGRVRSCMECHRDAPFGRLFGLPGHPPQRHE
ncbi:MAG: hypothetical protein AAGF12_02020 [Myxococcota bacterium]